MSAIGANCGSGPQPVRRVAGHLAQLDGAPPIGAWPNAGLPQRVGGRLVYTSGPEYFADSAVRMLEDGDLALRPRGLR